MFFVVSLGRSGTSFLAHLLDEVPGCSVYHEAPNDDDALVQAFKNPQHAASSIVGSRERLIASRIVASQCSIYGEVNSYLRYHVKALQELWQPTILHLVRDGRDVVRSIMNRDSFSPADWAHTGHFRPSNDEPWADEWANFDRFARVCWYWARTNRDLLEHNLPLVRLEDITTSYEDFSKQVLQPLQLRLPYSSWNQLAQRPRNVSENTGFPVWSEWSEKQKKQFEVICGDVMSRLEYEL